MRQGEQLSTSKNGLVRYGEVVNGCNVWFASGFSFVALLVASMLELQGNKHRDTMRLMRLKYEKSVLSRSGAAGSQILNLVLAIFDMYVYVDIYMNKKWCVKMTSPRKTAGKLARENVKTSKLPPP